MESLGKSKHLVLVSLKIGEDTQWFRDYHYAISSMVQHILA